ncbi:protein zyg-11 homolog B [Aplysia californica]|uniref:Protein zyg-11 homolog B n=1 Tax=Aplysia californica TaxID=6500 RepID=A0ABM1W2A7_APLCA|nr:protein zyg-11 homolog B [Aplysia californica]XP_035828800.1 protein zyg-11 homolog B [Aplysia californica]
MYDTPVSLQNYCVDFICDNLSALCEVQPLASTDSKQTKMVFKDPETCFHSTLSDQLLSTLSEKGKLNDESLSLFDPNATVLRHVSIHNAPVTSRGLRILKGHRVSQLEVTGIKDVTVNDVIGCLGEWTLSNLRILNVSRNTFLNNSKFCVVVSLSKLRNLHTLNVSFTEFNRHGLEIIAEDLPCLEVLDISCTEINDITPLRKCKNRLKSLSMYNLQLHRNSDPIGVVSELTHLVHLDVSNDATRDTIITSVATERFQVPDFLAKHDTCPNLVSLDVSGAPDVAPCIVETFVERHEKLNFLGLALTFISEYEMFQPESTWYRAHPNFKISGEVTESQIMESLRRYLPRSAYMQKALFKLFNLSQGTEEPREDIIRLVLPAMKSHPKMLSVQMAATACLYNLTRGDVGQKIHPVLLSRCVDLTLTAMENFPNHQQLQKNALLTICSDRILQDVNFDRFRCSRLVMDCMCQFDDASMNRMSVAICSILAAKISTEQTTILGAKARYMKKLLMLVEERLVNQELDITLRFTLSALWNLTDEAPSTCNVFLMEGGLELFMKLLELTDGQGTDNHVQVETKILGLLNNIAEVKNLRHKLMREEFVMLIKRMLHGVHIDVSYFAAGILAHLCSDGDTAWRNIAGLDRYDILEDLRSVVSGWDQPKSEMVAYRSFSPFFPLLQSLDPPIQLWAVWAIHHVCSKNGKRYLTLLDSEGGPEHVQRLMNGRCDSKVRGICEEILTKLEEHKGRPPRQQDTDDMEF